MWRHMASLLLLLVLSGCAAGAPPPSGPRETALEGTNWVLLRLGTVAATPTGSARPPNLRLTERRAGGFGGCNRLGGAYELSGAALRFGPLIATRMACMEGGAQEQPYFDALAAVRGWRLSGDRLTLTGADGAVLLEFEAKGAE